MTESVAAAPIPAEVSNRPFWKLPRRDFFFGGLAGLMVGKGSEYVQPMEWTKAGLPVGTTFSFAQYGEDLIVNGLLNALGVDKPSYLDIGAWEPILSNNTYYFYRKGGRGVLVEPNPARTPDLRKKRPHDTVLEAGVGLDDTPTMDYYMLSDEQLNTFDKAQVEYLTSTFNIKVKRVVTLPMLPINRVIADHFGGAAPDYLSIDVEGLDLAILKTLDFTRFRPKLICAETVITGTLKHNTEMTEFLATREYVIRGGTRANTVFLDNRLIG